MIFANQWQIVGFLERQRIERRTREILAICEHAGTSAFHTPARSCSSKYGLNASSLVGGAVRGPYCGANPAACMYLRIVLRSQPVNLLIAWILIPCRCSSFSSCTSLPLNKSRNLLRMEWSPVYHVKGGENSTGTMGIFVPALACATNRFQCRFPPPQRLSQNRELVQDKFDALSRATEHLSPFIGEQFGTIHQTSRFDLACCAGDSDAIARGL